MATRSSLHAYKLQYYIMRAGNPLHVHRYMRICSIQRSNYRKLDRSIEFAKGARAPARGAVLCCACACELCISHAHAYHIAQAVLVGGVFNLRSSAPNVHVAQLMQEDRRNGVKYGGTGRRGDGGSYVSDRRRKSLLLPIAVWIQISILWWSRCASIRSYHGL